MSAPLIWIIFPLAVSVGLFFVQRRRSLAVILSGIVCFGLVAMALLVSIASPIKAGLLSFSISPTLEILGRRFVLENGDRAFLVIVYLTAGFWFLGSIVAGANRLF